MVLWCKQGGAAAAVLAMVAVVAVGCGPRDGGQMGDSRPGASRPAPRTALSGYLAGRFAQGTGDSAAAADYYAQALKFDPDNAELLQRTFGLMAAEGRMDIAAPLATPAIARPQWPERPVRVIVPWPPGGSTDVLCRLICERLQAATGQSFLVENRPGAGGNIGGAAAATHVGAAGVAASSATPAISPSSLPIGSRGPSTEDGGGGVDSAREALPSSQSADGSGGGQ